MMHRRRSGWKSRGVLMNKARILPLTVAACLAYGTVPTAVLADQAYQVFVTNERSGDVTVINGAHNKVIDTIAVGKRPRGIHASADGSTLYVALSGTQLQAP